MTSKEFELPRQSTISVSGTGRVLAQPDMVKMSITLSNIAQTTKIAQEAVNKMVKQAMKILKEANIENKNINTDWLSFHEETEYNEEIKKWILIGQKAQQEITFSIEDIDGNNEKASRIIDKLIQINGIRLGSTYFCVKDPTEYFIKAREFAYKNAFEKASQYAELSNLKIIKVLSISEDGIHHVPQRSYEDANYAPSMPEDEDCRTELPVGELEIRTHIAVLFLLE